jgi:hypothetical protein
MIRAAASPRLPAPPVTMHTLLSSFPTRLPLASWVDAAVSPFRRGRAGRKICIEICDHPPLAAALEVLRGRLKPKLATSAAFSKRLADAWRIATLCGSGEILNIDGLGPNNLGAPSLRPTHIEWCAQARRR